MVAESRASFPATASPAAAADGRTTPMWPRFRRRSSRASLRASPSKRLHTQRLAQLHFTAFARAKQSWVSASESSASASSVSLRSGSFSPQAATASGSTSTERQWSSQPRLERRRLCATTQRSSRPSAISASSSGSTRCSSARVDARLIRSTSRRGWHATEAASSWSATSSSPQTAKFSTARSSSYGFRARMARDATTASTRRGVAICHPVTSAGRSSGTSRRFCSSSRAAGCKCRPSRRIGFLSTMPPTRIRS